MTRRLPPLPALRAFEAAARHLSFRDAAEELNVTPSAVSHQVRTLEDHLGRALFRRAGNRIALAPAAAAYLERVTGLLDELDAATREVSGRADDAALRLLCTPGFAARWLVPRLGRYEGRDGIRIDVSQGAPSTDFTRNGADVVIAWGADPVPGADVEPLMESVRYPVASPAFRAAERLRRPRDLLRVTLFHDEVLDAWGRWFRLAGVVPPALPRGPRLAHCELTLGGAEQEQGVALAYDAMARGALCDGRLVRLFETETPAITIYSLCTERRRRSDPRIRAFRDWILAEVEAEGTRDRGDRAAR